MFVGVHFDFVHNLLNIGDALGKSFRLDLLLRRFYRAFEDQGSILRGVFDALVVEGLVGFDVGLVVIFDGVIEA